MKRLAAIGGAAWVAGLLMLTGCALPPPTPSATIIPGYEFSIGANRSDIEAVLGFPEAGPRMDRLTNLVEMIYAFPFDGFTVDTRMSDGTVRSEVTNRVYLFFDSRGRLVKMTNRPNRNYHAFTDTPVDRVKVAPRLRTLDGSIGPANVAR